MQTKDSDGGEEAKAIPPPPRFAQHAKERIVEEGREQRGIIIGLSDFAASFYLSLSLKQKDKMTPLPFLCQLCRRRH